MAGAPFSPSQRGGYDAVYIQESLSEDSEIYDAIQAVRSHGIYAALSAAGFHEKGGRIILVNRGHGQRAADLLQNAGYTVIENPRKF